MGHHQLLIVDDEPDLRWVLRGLFEDAGFEVREAGGGEEALQQVDQSPPDVVLSDMRMPRMSGLELLRTLHRRLPTLPVILLSAVEDLATAVDAIKEGAFDYQAKPFDAERLQLSVRRAAEQHALRRELQQLRSSLPGQNADFGPGRKAQELRRLLELLAPQTSVAVLLSGESGTGKEVAARTLHALSPCANGPFVAVDCGALPEQLLESQLFGHEKGAFTGADRARPGLFSMADGGTLFLDELGNLPLGLQAKLLRALQERTVVPVGGSQPVPFRARLVCATNAALTEAVQAGQFRVDLYHRIAEFTVALPSLRERPEDIVHFARVFLAEANQELGRHVQGFTAAGEQALRQHPWPGNLRELRNAVRRTVLTAAATELDACDLLLPPGGDRPPEAADGARSAETDATLPLADRLRVATDALEAEILTSTLAQCSGNKAAAARALRIDYTTLHRKLKRHGLAGS
ncbi:MAG: sigma-54 dependent transcriptional regulator [Planctomycetes bacterium]|jgi:DNA-binding NtrC family response regulator|nr:sigma-54 dependent transcriptional regulator [Planctomycetota bacterium]